MSKLLLLNIAIAIFSIVSCDVTRAETLPVWPEDGNCVRGCDYRKDCNICFCGKWGPACTELECDTLPADVSAQIATGEVVPYPGGGVPRVRGQIYKNKCGYAIQDQDGALNTVPHCDEMNYECNQIN